MTHIKARKIVIIDPSSPENTQFYLKIYLKYIGNNTKVIDIQRKYQENYRRKRYEEETKKIQEMVQMIAPEK